MTYKVRFRFECDVRGGVVAFRVPWVQVRPTILNCIEVRGLTYIASVPSPLSEVGNRTSACLGQFTMGLWRKGADHGSHIQ